MTAKQVAGLAERRIRQIQALPEHPRRAALANLRRGVGRAPGELPELWGSFLQEMPPEFFTQSGSATAAEWAVYLALTLFALHQQSQEKPMCAQGAGIGQAVRRLSNRQKEDPQESGAFKRFSALVTSNSIEEVSQHLRGLIQLLRSEGLPLDYPKLAFDLFELQFPDSAPRVKLRWGQDYFCQPQETQDGQEKEDSHE